MRRFLPLCLALATPATASPVADVLCAPTPQMQTKLETQYGTTRTASGLRDREQVMEVWTDDSGDWIMVAAYASGTSCIVAMGEHWTDTKNPA